ncbi:MAG: hypothetical protein HYX68_04880 [Planctomycetes bacterium]|nr:hypothetical protein [Planctomycetota bacterium]
MTPTKSNPIRARECANGQKPIISQAMFEEFTELQTMRKRCDALRTTLLQRLDDGADVESGRLALEIVTKSEQRLKKADLIRWFGAAEYARLLESAEPTAITYLKVVPRLARGMNGITPRCEVGV